MPAIRGLPGRLVGLVLLSLLGHLAACSDQVSGPERHRVLLALSGGGPPVKVDEAIPSSAPQDTTLDVRILGSGFDDGSVATFTIDGVAQPKVRTNSTRFVSASELAANVTIALDAPLDLYDVEVMTTRGKKGIGADKFQVVQKGGKPGVPPADPTVAFVSFGPESSRNLSVMNADGSNQTVILQGNVSHPSWSPDGASVAMAGSGGGLSGVLIVDVAVVGGTPTASNLRKIADGSSPDWSPTGGNIAFVGDGSTIKLVPAGGGLPITAYTSPPGLSPNHPDWSPDGSKLVFMESTLDPGVYQYSLRVLDLATAAVTTVIPLSDFLTRFPAWSRSGDRIAYSGYPASGGREAIYTVPPTAGATPIKLINGGAGPTWSPDDTRIALIGGKNGSQVLTLTLATGATQTLAGSGWMPDWRRF